MMITVNPDEARRGIALSVLEGDLDAARRWAFELAVHRDNELTLAERVALLVTA